MGQTYKAKQNLSADLSMMKVSFCLGASYSGVTASTSPLIFNGEQIVFEGQSSISGLNGIADALRDLASEIENYK